MNRIEEIFNSFNINKDNYTCKKCNKVLKVEHSTSGELTFEQRLFLILARHREECV